MDILNLPDIDVIERTQSLNAPSSFLSIPTGPMPEYVPVEEYEALRAILQQWLDMPNLVDCHDEMEGWQSDKLRQLRADTEAALVAQPGNNLGTSGPAD